MKINHGLILSSLIKCSQYLTNNILEDGRFVYEINAKTGVVFKGYNILRHAGSLYMMYQTLPMNLSKKKMTLPILEKGVAYLKQQVRPLKNNQDIFCVVENNEAKLGGTALALLALLEQYKIYNNTERLTLMYKMASFLVYMQNQDGSFKSKILYHTRPWIMP